MAAVDDRGFLDSLLADVTTVTEIVRSSPREPVAHCPGWSVADLVDHHGEVLRWAARIVDSGERVGEEFRGPSDVTELADWYTAGAQEFVSVARSVDRDRACWTFGGPPGKTWFWIRRQALEAAIHRWDAEFAIGRPGGFPTGVASAGITEVVEDFFPRQIALLRSTGLSAAVALHATDSDEGWILGRDRGADPVAVVKGPAAVLFLLLWRRTNVDDHRVEYSGPAELAREIRATRFAP